MISYEPLQYYNVDHAIIIPPGETGDFRELSTKKKISKKNLINFKLDYVRTTAAPSNFNRSTIERVTFCWLRTRVYNFN